MKKVNTIFLFAVFIIATSVIYTGCKKDRIQQTQLNTYDSPDPYLDSKKAQEKEFTIDTTGSGPITGKDGTKILLGKECLMYPNGDTVYYPYTLKLVELYKPKDMIYYRMPTVAGGYILRTEGEISLRAFKNGTELMLRPKPCFAQIELKSSSPRAGMRVFYGFEYNGHPDWIDDPAALGTPSSLSPVFTTTSYGYQAQIARLGWIGADSVILNGNRSKLSFESTVDDLKNVRFFIYIPSTKTVMEVYDLAATDEIPNGFDIKIIGIGLKSGTTTLYHFYKEMKVTSSEKIDVEMKEISDPDLTALLSGL